MRRSTWSTLRPHIPSPPRPPALVTAAASRGVLALPMGACRIGHLRFSLSVKAFVGHMHAHSRPCPRSCRVGYPSSHLTSECGFLDCRQLKRERPPRANPRNCIYKCVGVACVFGGVRKIEQAFTIWRRAVWRDLDRFGIISSNRQTSVARSIGHIAPKAVNEL